MRLKVRGGGRKQIIAARRGEPLRSRPGTFVWRFRCLIHGCTLVRNGHVLALQPLCRTSCAGVLRWIFGCDALRTQNHEYSAGPEIKGPTLTLRRRQFVQATITLRGCLKSCGRKWRGRGAFRSAVQLRERAQSHLYASESDSVCLIRSTNRAVRGRSTRSRAEHSVQLVPDC